MTMYLVVSNTKYFLYNNKKTCCLISLFALQWKGKSLVDHITPTTTKANASYPLMQMYFMQLESILVQDNFGKSHTTITIAV